MGLPFDRASQYAIVIDDKNHDPLFTNVAIGTWYESAVHYVYTHCIMQGMSETAFSPNTSLTRAKAASILMRFDLNLVKAD